MPSVRLPELHIAPILSLSEQVALKTMIADMRRRPPTMEAWFRALKLAGSIIEPMPPRRTIRLPRLHQSWARGLPKASKGQRRSSSCHE